MTPERIAELYEVGGQQLLECLDEIERLQADNEDKASRIMQYKYREGYVEPINPYEVSESMRRRKNIQKGKTM